MAIIRRILIWAAILEEELDQGRIDRQGKLGRLDKAGKAERAEKAEKEEVLTII